MLRAKPDSDQAGRYTAQQRPLSEEPQQQRRRRFSDALENAPNHPVLDEQLEALRRASRELPTALDRLQSVHTGGSLQQARGQDVGGGNGVLDRQIYPNTADRRHGVSRISNTQQARPVPNPKAIDSDSQQFDVGPIAEFADAITEVGARRVISPRKAVKPPWRI